MKYKYAIVMVMAIVVCAIVTIANNHLTKQNGLIFTLLRPELQRASDDFYSEYLTSNPNIANYSGKVLSIRKENEGYYVRLGISPYVGAHDPVGDDEVEYFVDNLGNVELVKFEHKRNYEILPRWNVKVKKGIPVE